jgi:16S rRNA G966 N2-methylase RsmD
LKKNIEKAGFIRESKVIRANAFKIGAPPLRDTLRWVDEQKYDLIFVDPPYSVTDEVGENSPLSGLMMVLSEQLAPRGIVMVRTEKHSELPQQYGRLRIIDKRRWGSMTVTILGQISNDQQTSSN